MNKRIVLVLVVIIIGILAVRCWQSYHSKDTFVPIPSTPTSNFVDVTFDIEGLPVTLVNGLSEAAIPDSTAKVVTKYFGNELRTDLNSDGKEDAVFLLTQETGGSGIFYYVAASLGSDNGFHGTNAILLGDRIAPQTTEARGSEIIINYADRKKGEPMSAQPSIGTSRYFKIVEGKLVALEK
jgi:hypothetical protein